jgi:hypothetical protein
MTFELEYCKVLPPSILYYETRSLIARLAIFVAWNMKRVKGQNEIIRRLNHQSSMVVFELIGFFFQSTVKMLFSMITAIYCVALEVIAVK